MAYIPFDLISKYKKDEPIQIDITLCKPNYNRTPMQIISTAYSKELTKRFGSIDEINFQIPQTIDGKGVNEDFNLVKGDFVLLVEFDNQKQYFIVKQCDNVVSGKQVHKEVVAYSYEYIFGNKLIRGWSEGQQPLSYVMDYVISCFPSWQLGIVEPQLMVIERTMEVSEQSVLEFLIDVQKKYLCIFEFDTVNRTINIRKVENIGKNKGFVLSERNYINKINVEPNFQEVVTRLRCYGKDGLSINELNPTGQAHIELYDYYMIGFSKESDEKGGWIVTGHSEYMSDGLCMALLEYRDLMSKNSTVLSLKYEELTDLQTEMNRLLNVSDEGDKGLNILKTSLEGIQLQIDALIRIGTSDLSKLKNQERELIIVIENKQKEVDKQQLLLDEKNNEISTFKELLKIENNFTTEQIKELDMFTREKTWSDSSYFDAADLYNEGSKMLLKMAQPAIKFNVDVMNFLRCLDRSEDWECITTGLGDIVTIEIDSLDLTLEVRVLEYTYSETANSIDVSFSNKDSIDDPSVYLKDLLKSSVSTSTTLSMEKFKYGRYEKERTEFTDFIDGKLDLAKKRAFAGIDQEVIIDERGILLTDTSNKDRQLKLIGDLITFSTDGWNTCGTAINSEGIVAEAIYGKVIAGANLTIENTSGTFQVNENGVTLAGQNLTITNGLPESQIDSSAVNKWNSAEKNAKKYVDGEIKEVNNSITDLENSLSSIFTDGEVTLVEANSLGLTFSVVQSESTDLINGATSLGITTERTNYSKALSTLQKALSLFINKSEGSYPIKITTGQRTNIDTAFKNVQNKKSILINKIAKTREDIAKKYTDNNAVSIKKPYNGVRINATDGMVVRTNDKDVRGTIRTTLNASDGIKIDYHNGTSWHERFKVDSSTGNIIANNLQLTGGKIINSRGKTVLDISSGTLNWNDLVINGTLTADKVKSDWIYTRGIKLSQIQQNGSLTIRNGSTTTFKIDSSGNITLGGNITWNSKPRYSYSELSNRPHIPREYDDSDVEDFLTGTRGIVYKNGKLSVLADSIVGNEFKALDKIVIGESRNETSSKSLEFKSGTSIHTFREDGLYSGVAITASTIRCEAYALELPANISSAVYGNTINFMGKYTFENATSVEWGKNAPKAVFG